MKLRERPILLITGGTGFLGYNAIRSLRFQFEVSYTYHRENMPIPGVRGYPLDLSSEQSIARVLEMVQPDAVLHLAALTDAAACEADSRLAHKINARPVEQLLSACGGDVRLIYVSTDYVRHGKQKNLIEDVLCRPTSAYGKSKYYAEQVVEEAFSRGHLILRTALVYGWGKGPRHGFMDWLWGSLSQDRPVKLYEDEYRTPVFLPDWIDAVKAAARYPYGGRFNIAGSVRMSRYELGQRFAETMGKDPSLVQPARLADAPDAAFRPREGSLSNEKMRSLLAIVPTSTDRAFEKIREEILARED